ncbi:MacB-like core domain-containing protein [Ekhidna lutea]|uniref:MacB-like core domain-containing protein n=1 Tax=Ekhidna lutea TaxID=447679 RepID=A0A239EEA4_EKHLU|nr:FtsX-like permease family protein [Ekhidna lutea]SNS42947.1 MacB-like core domain-containing protein [Ekhidna lutea]
MIRNFFKITFRNFRKNKSYVFINMLGLGLSLACCIVGYLNWKFAAEYDQNHANHERIYKVQIYKDVQNQNVPYGISPLPLGAVIKDKVAGVTHISRYIETGLVLKKELKVFNQGIAFAEDDFLEMFTFPLKYGNESAFLDRSKIILSYYTADTYFGEGVDPTGEIITIITEDGKQYPMTIGGVFEEIPQNSSVRFSALTHFDNYLKIREVENTDWKQFVAATFVMTDGQFPQNLLEDVNVNYVEVQNKARDDFKIGSYYAVQLTNLGSIAESIRANWLSEPPPPPAVVVPMIMAFLMLLIACFNFTNTSIAISSKRLKEIGIRKVMGSDRKQLIFQFMGENLILSFLSLLVALGFAYFLVPAYSAMWDFITLELNLVSDSEIYLFLIGLLVLTSVIAGGYPSLYISAYQPVNILRGSLSLGGTNWFSKTLLGLQYMLTIIALISALAFTNNAEYQNNLDVGFQKENILGVRVENKSEYDRFFNLINQMPEIEQMTGTTHHIGWWTYGRTLRAGEQEVESDMMNFSLDYKEIMNLTIKDGRYFDKDLYEFDKENSIIMNEALVREFGWDQPIGKVVQIDDSTRLSVVGVMEDFYMYGFFDPVEPCAFRLADKEEMNFVVIKSEVNPTELRDKMEEKWYEVAPNTPFNASFMDEELAGTDYVNNNISTMFKFLGALALILSSIGLYTLVSLNIIKRVKEIGVRKVLGASVNQILVLMNKQFFWLLLLFAWIGAGLSYFAIDALMASIFAVYQAISVFTVLAPFFLLMIIAVGIASSRIMRTATQNPVKSLRYE